MDEKLIALLNKKLNEGYLPAVNTLFVWASTQGMLEIIQEEGGSIPANDPPTQRKIGERVAKIFNEFKSKEKEYLDALMSDTSLNEKVLKMSGDYNNKLLQTLFNNDHSVYLTLIKQKAIIFIDGNVVKQKMEEFKASA